MIKKSTAIVGFALMLAISWGNAATTQTDYPRNLTYTAESVYRKENSRYTGLKVASTVLANGLRVWPERAYKDVGYRTLAMDIYAPKVADAKTPAHFLPAILLVHGGGWSSGDKGMLAPLAMSLAQRGFVVASINYRLSPEAKFPAGYEDVVDSVAFFKNHANDYGANAKAIALGGTSAGGQLASLVAYSGGKLHGNKRHAKVEVQALLNIDGLLDFSSAEALPFENDPSKTITSASAWLGGRYEEVPDVWKMASAYFYVSKKSPPTLFLNSAQARFHAGRDATMVELNKAKVYSTMTTLPSSPHGFWLFDNWLPASVIACSDFLYGLNAFRD